MHFQLAKADLNLTVAQDQSKVSGGVKHNTYRLGENTGEEMIFRFRTIESRVDEVAGRMA